MTGRITDPSGALDSISDTTIVQSQFVILPSVQATQEFKVQSNSIKAEFGRTGVTCGAGGFGAIGPASSARIVPFGLKFYS